MVNAFRHGMDSQQLQQATSNPNLQRVLQKQASLSKQRLSSMSSSDAAGALGLGGPGAGAASGVNMCPNYSGTRIKLPPQETSYSHTETAV